MKRILVYLAIVAAASTQLMYSETALALVPSVLTQQGRLLDSQDLPVTATQQFVFSIYDAASGGSLLWSETQEVTLDDGYFSARLGEITPISFAFAGGATRYLGVKVGTDAEMVPRQALSSVPYALLANNVVGDITPSSITIGGTQIIDDTGHWMGPNSGLIGPTGPKGDTGLTGATGPVGAAGEVGPAGPKGDIGLTGATGATGPAGATGAIGPIGPAGATGAIGPIGPAGATGAIGPMGATGPAGAPGIAGAVGPIGPAGPIGPDGPQGPQGPQGIQGIAGAQGPMGVQGPVGVPGPAGVVATASWAGFISDIASGSPSNGTWVFVGPTVAVTTTANQRISAVSEAPLALSTGGPQDFQYDLCYQPSGGGSLSNFAGGNFSIGQLLNTRQSWTATGSKLTGVGTWNVGFCLINLGAGAIDNVDFVNGWLQVTN